MTSKSRVSQCIACGKAGFACLCAPSWSAALPRHRPIGSAQKAKMNRDQYNVLLREEARNARKTAAVEKEEKLLDFIAFHENRRAAEAQRAQGKKRKLSDPFSVQRPCHKGAAEYEPEELGELLELSGKIHDLHKRAKIRVMKKRAIYKRIMAAKPSSNEEVDALFNNPGRLYTTKTLKINYDNNDDDDDL